MEPSLPFGRTRTRSSTAIPGFEPRKGLDPKVYQPSRSPHSLRPKKGWRSTTLRRLSRPEQSNGAEPHSAAIDQRDA